MGGMRTLQLDCHIVVLGRPLHRSFQNFPNTLGWGWEMGQEFGSGKNCGEGIDLCALNS